MVDKIIDNAVTLITEQMDKHSKGQAERRAGRLMIKLCEANPNAAELIGQDIVQESMSLAKVTDKVRQTAHAQAKFIAQEMVQESVSLANITDKVSQTALTQAKCMAQKLQCRTTECEYDDEDYLEIICTFYGIHEPMQSVETVIRVGVNRKVVSFMDLLGG